MITDTMLGNVAVSITSDSYNAYMAVTTDTSFSADADATDIGTELGSRIATAESTLGVVVQASATRSGAIVTTDTGDVLTGVGWFDTSTAGDLAVSVPLPSLSHTSGFDIEFDLEITVTRR